MQTNFYPKQDRAQPGADIHHDLSCQVRQGVPIQELQFRQGRGMRNELWREKAKVKAGLGQASTAVPRVASLQALLLWGFRPARDRKANTRGRIGDSGPNPAQPSSTDVVLPRGQTLHLAAGVQSPRPPQGEVCSLPAGLHYSCIGIGKLDGIGP